MATDVTSKVKFNNLHDIVFDSSAGLKSKEHALDGTKVLVKGAKSANGQPLLNFLGASEDALTIAASEEQDGDAFEISRMKLSK